MVAQLQASPAPQPIRAAEAKCGRITLQPGFQTYVDGPNQFVAIGSLQPDTITSPHGWNGRFSLNITYRILPYRGVLEFQPPKVVLVDSQYAELETECEGAPCALDGQPGVQLRRVWHGQSLRLPGAPTPVLLALQSTPTSNQYIVEITDGTICFYF